MILETDQALLSLLKTEVLGGAQIGVSFDPPSRPWIQALKAPTINLFLFDLRENVQRRESAFEDIRDDNGRVVGYKPPMQRWDLHYTVSVFAPQIAIEHRILAVVLRYFSQLDVLPEQALPQPLAELGYPVLVSTGSGPKRGMFLNYAGDMKVGFEMAITVPIPPAPPAPPAPAVQQPPVIQVAPSVAAAAPNAASATETVQASTSPPPPTAPPLPTAPPPPTAPPLSTAPAPPTAPAAATPPATPSETPSADVPPTSAD